MTQITKDIGFAAGRNGGEVRALVIDAVRDHIPLIDYGRAHANLGHAPPAHHTKLTQTIDPANGGILEHYTRDLTVRAAAGITLAALQAALKPTNQFVPLDADDDITLGEIIHHNMYGPLRVAYGSIRDLLLGLHYIDGDGRDIHVGGRTVKNVAGYDVTRFMVGSLGELGIVHEATLRTYAIPEHVLEVELSMQDPRELDEQGTDLILSDAKPAHLSYCYHCGRREGKGDWFVHLAYFGKHTANLVQLRALELFCDRMPAVHLIGSNDSTLQRDDDERAVRRAWRRSAPAVVKIIVPPAATGEVCHRLGEWISRHQPLHIEALPLHGCVFAGGELDAKTAASLDATVNEAIAALGGMRAWHARPRGAETIEPFGPPQSDWAILKKLKRMMDPHNVFNPGRFLR
ncbi:MAG: FAD-binding oxidoreductase [Phycisphaeraceae bacterium]